MVNHFTSFLFFTILSIPLFADPIIDSSIDLFQNYANYPLTGTVTITHDRNEKIDDNSFQMEGKPLNTTIIKEVPFSSQDTLVTIYNFQLPAQSAGSYTLPPVSVKINGKIYQSTPSPYELKTNQGQSFSLPLSKKQKAQDSTPITFQIDSKVQGPSKLHPGERTKLFYRISFNRSIDLSKSDLPFVHPEHFKKIGDVQIKEYQEGGLSIQELTQEIEAADIGSFQLGPSKIEGYAYTSDATGEKIYSSALLQADSPAITIQVTPFPKTQQPLSFTGAFGTIKIEDTLISSPKATVGDTLKLQVKIEGVSNLNSFRLPSLACQPGFSGFFQMNDLPPIADFDETRQTKSFEVELRPLTTLATNIPSIEVSSYHLDNGQYITMTTKPIHIQIVDGPEEGDHQADHHLPILSPTRSFQWPKPKLESLKLSETERFELDPSLPWINTCRVLWLFPFGALILLLQIWTKRTLRAKPKSPTPASTELFKKASQHFPDPIYNIRLLEKAFWLRLYEEEAILEGTCHLEELSQGGKIGSIRSFIGYLQALQYGQNHLFDLDKVLKQAKDLSH